MVGDLVIRVEATCVRVDMLFGLEFLSHTLLQIDVFDWCDGLHLGQFFSNDGSTHFLSRRGLLLKLAERSGGRCAHPHAGMRRGQVVHLALSHVFQVPQLLLLELNRLLECLSKVLFHYLLQKMQVLFLQGLLALHLCLYLVGELHLRLLFFDFVDYVFFLLKVAVSFLLKLLMSLHLILLR